jgi:hypothetical protein
MNKTRELLSGELLTASQMSRARRTFGRRTRFLEHARALVVPVGTELFFYNGVSAWREPGNTVAGVGALPLDGPGCVRLGACGVDVFLTAACDWKRFWDEQRAEQRTES